MEKRSETTLHGTQIKSAPEDQRRVVVRYIDGSTLRGFITLADVEKLNKNAWESVHVRKTDGEMELVHMEGIKAIFFVKTFEGSRHYSEFKVFTNQPNGKGVWVRVQFHDGEIMEGVASNSLATYSHVVFSLTPPDPQSNNQSVLVSKLGLREMQILGLATD